MSEPKKGKPGFELEDSYPTLAAALALVLVLVIFLTFVVTMGMNRMIRPSASENKPSALAMEQLHRQPPEPRLQVNEAVDYQQVRKAEDAALSTYGWVNRPQGVARIPIERAMAIVAEEGLPSRPAASEVSR